jgi:regulator of RNase E activity RraA
MDVTGLKCADLVDAMGRMHRHRCHILDLVSPTPGRTLFGQAVTISYFPSCSADLDPRRYTLANLFYEAVGDEPAGKVLMLASVADAASREEIAREQLRAAVTAPQPVRSREWTLS